MKQVQKQRILENIKNRRQSDSSEILEETRVIRRKITEDTGQWDSVAELRDLRDFVMNIGALY